MYGDVCDKCAHSEYCDMATFGGHNPKITACCKFARRHQTNADRIRAMTDEELAEKIAALMACMECPLLEMCERANPRRCIDMWLDWLKSPVKKEVDNG
jgi:hypothetical protein